MAKNGYSFKVCRDGDAEGAKIEYDYHNDLVVHFKDMDPVAFTDRLTFEEIVAHKDCSGLVAALVKRHGLNEVVAHLVDTPGSDVYKVISAVADYTDPSEVAHWVDGYYNGGE